MTCADVIEFLKKPANLVIATDESGTRVGVLMRDTGARSEVHRKWFSGGNLMDAVSNASKELDKTMSVG